MNANIGGSGNSGFFCVLDNYFPETGVRFVPTRETRIYAVSRDNGKGNKRKTYRFRAEMGYAPYLLIAGRTVHIIGTTSRERLKILPLSRYHKMNTQLKIGHIKNGNTFHEKVWKAWFPWTVFFWDL